MCTNLATAVIVFEPTIADLAIRDVMSTVYVPKMALEQIRKHENQLGKIIRII